MTTPPTRAGGPLVWLVGGAAALLALLLCATTAVIFALRAADRLGAPEDVPALPEHTPAVPDLVGPEYGPAPELCQATDFSAVFEILPLSEIGYDQEHEGILYQRSCDLMLDDGSSRGLFSLHAAIYPTPERAGDAYQESAAVPVVGGTAQQPTGDWVEAILFEDESDRFGGQAEVELVLWDSTLVLHLIFGVTGAAADPDSQRAAVFESADIVRDQLRPSR